MNKNVNPGDFAALSLYHKGLATAPHISDSRPHVLHLGRMLRGAEDGVSFRPHIEHRMAIHELTAEQIADASLAALLLLLALAPGCSSASSSAGTVAVNATQDMQVQNLTACMNKNYPTSFSSPPSWNEAFVKKIAQVCGDQSVYEYTSGSDICVVYYACSGHA